MVAAAIALATAADGRAAPTVSAPVDLVGSSSPVSSSTCIREIEPVLTRTNSESPVWLFAALGTNNVTSTTGGWNSWIKDTTAPDANTPLWIEQGPGVAPMSGDGWATFSETNDMVYASFIGSPNLCLAIGATTATDVPSEDWDYPATCAVNLPSDHPVIAFDNYPGAPALFSVANPLNGNVRVDAFVPCNTGQPGVPGGGCARSATTTFTLAQNHYDAAVNDCSGNLLVAYRENTTNDIRLLSLHRLTLAPLSTPSKGALVMASQTWSGSAGPTNTGCGHGTIRRCGQGTSDCRPPGETNDMCQRVFGGPELVVERHTDGQCYAAVTWDVFVADSGGNLWSRSRVAILKVTNDSSPTLIRTQISNGNPQNQWNDYMSQVVAAPANDSLGWFWETDGWGACNQFLAGGVDTNFGITSFSGTGKFPSYTWPAAAMGAAPPISDYWKGTGRGTKLYPVWVEAVPTPASCAWGTCLGTRYNTAAKTVEVTP
jgi:hypothetical protein